MGTENYHSSYYYDDDDYDYEYIIIIDEVELHVLRYWLTFIRDMLRPVREHGSVLLYIHGNHKAR